MAASRVGGFDVPDALLFRFLLTLQLRLGKAQQLNVTVSVPSYKQPVGIRDGGDEPAVCVDIVDRAQVEVLPMFPDTCVTYVPDCSAFRTSNHF